MSDKAGGINCGNVFGGAVSVGALDEFEVGVSDIIITDSGKTVGAQSKRGILADRAGGINSDRSLPSNGARST